MNNKCLEIRKQAQDCLGELSIMDSNGFITNLLFELTETDDSNLEIKAETLSNIQTLLSVRNKIKKNNNDLYLLRTLTEQLRLEQENEMKTYPLIKVVNSLKEEKYFITLKSANDYITSLNNKDNVQIIKLQNNELEELINIIKRNFYNS